MASSTFVADAWLTYLLLTAQKPARPMARFFQPLTELPPRDATPTILAALAVGEPVPVAFANAGGSVYRSTAELAINGPRGEQVAAFAILDGPTTDDNMLFLGSTPPVTLGSTGTAVVQSSAVRVEVDPVDPVNGNAFTAPFQKQMAEWWLDTVTTVDFALLAGQTRAVLQRTRGSSGAVESQQVTGKPAAPYADAPILWGPPAAGRSDARGPVSFAVPSPFSVGYVTVAGTVTTTGTPPGTSQRAMFYKRIDGGPVAITEPSVVTFAPGTFSVQIG